MNEWMDVSLWWGSPHPRGAGALAWAKRRCRGGQALHGGAERRRRHQLQVTYLARAGKAPKGGPCTPARGCNIFWTPPGRWSCSTSTTTRPPDHSQHRPWTRPRPNPRRRPPPHRSISPTGHGSSTHHHRPSCRSAGRRPPSSSSRKVSELPHRPRGRPPDEAKAA